MYNGRMSYIQRDNVGEGDFFLFHHKDGVWLVGPYLGFTRNHIQHSSDSIRPPSSGWGYWGKKRTFLARDPTLKLHPGHLQPCRKVTVEGNEEVTHLQSTSLGSYKPMGKWREGRPVYEREGQPPRFLLVREGLSGWTVKKALDATSSTISGGRATNFPGKESGPGDRYGQKNWKWFNAHLKAWVEGGVNVTCQMK